MVDNEKKAFNKMKNDFIKQSADINIMKEDMGELMKNLHFLMRRMDTLEEENKNLRKHNSNLVKFVKNIGEGNSGIRNNIDIIEVGFNILIINNLGLYKRTARSPRQIPKSNLSN